MTPLTMLGLAAAAAVVGAGVGRSQERLVRRAGGPRGTSAMVDGGLERIRWVAPAVAVTLGLRTAMSAQPSAALVWLPLAVIGPWLLAVLATGIGSAERVLAAAAFFTANGIIVNIAFTGRAEALLTAPVGLLILGGVGLAARRLAGGRAGEVEVRVAAVVGLAAGAFGWQPMALALLWSLVVFGVSWAVRRLAQPRIAPALLAGAWAAAIVVL